MPQNNVEDAIQKAGDACKHGALTRKLHRRRTAKGSEQREEDLELALERVRKAMVPIRSFIGKSPYMRQTKKNLAMLERVRAASFQLQAERRKLWKMQKKQEDKTDDRSV